MYTLITQPRAAVKARTDFNLLTSWKSMKLEYSIFILHFRYLKLTFEVVFLPCQYEFFMNLF